MIKKRVVIIHNHLFKNAGSTIDWALRKNFGEGFIDHRNDGDMKKGPKYLGSFVLENPDIKALSSHHLTLPIPSLDGLYLPQIMMFRHPIERVSSVYHFERKQVNAETPGAIQARKYGLKRYVERGMENNGKIPIRNFHLTRCIPPRKFWGKPFTEEEILAARTFVTSLEMLGLVERFDESMVLFEYYLEEYFPNIDLSYQPQNIGQNRDETRTERIRRLQDELGDDIFLLLSENNKEDLLLYEYATNLFEERIAGVPNFESRLDDFSLRCARILEREKEHISLTEKYEQELGKWKNLCGLKEQELFALQKRYEVNEKVSADRLTQMSQLQKALESKNKDLSAVTASISFRFGRILTYPLRKPVENILQAIQENSRAMMLVRIIKSCLASPLATLKMLSLAQFKTFFILLRYPGLSDEIIGNYISSLAQGTRLLSENELKEYAIHGNLPLQFPEYSNPLVSIIIPVYNQLCYTLNCLESIMRYRPDIPYEVIVADDFSTDYTNKVLSKIKGLIYIRNPQNLGFLKSCNRSVDFAKGKYIFLLNNDTVVRPGWLNESLKVFHENSDVGLVGSKLLLPNGKLQEAGGIIWNDASGWNYGRDDDAEKPEYSYLKEVDYVSGAAIMFPKALFLQLGKFDERYMPAYYEDTDLALKVRAAGKKVYMQPTSVIVHFEGVSNGKEPNLGVKRYQIINQQKFLEKWKAELESDQFPNEENFFTARDRSKNKITVLVIDHYVPHFDQDAGGRSTFLYLRLLATHGFNVKFIGDNYCKHEPYTGILQQLGIEVLYGNYYANHWKSWLRENAEHIDIIYLHRPHIAEKYIDFINQLFHKPKTIYFGHDLHYLRLKRQYDLEKNKKLLEEAEDWKRREFTLFEKVDLVYYPSYFEVNEIKKVLPELNIKAIPLYVFDCHKRTFDSFRGRRDIIFVGGFKHLPNVDGIQWFCHDIFPKVQRMLPGIKLHIVGSNAPTSVSLLENENVIFHGFISDEALEVLYDSIRLCVVPLRYGAGVKGKVLEAMDKGIPVVTTSIGAEGIPQSDCCLAVHNDEYKLAEEIVRLYHDDKVAGQLVKNAFKVIQTYFSEEAVLHSIGSDFNPN